MGRIVEHAQAYARVLEIALEESFGKFQATPPGASVQTEPFAVLK